MGRGRDRRREEGRGGRGVMDGESDVSTED